MDDKQVRVVIRGFRGGKKVFEHEAHTLEEVGRLADRHARIFGTDAAPFMVEFEFLDEPDTGARFARFGTDPRLMRYPIKTEWKQIADLLFRKGNKHT